MKKILLTCLSLIIAGQFCFASDTKGFKQEISNNEGVFSDLKNSLEESYQESEALTQLVGVDSLAVNTPDPAAIIRSKYPEFLNTSIEPSLKEAIKKDPNLTIKSVSYKIPDFDMTSTSSQSVLTLWDSKGKGILVTGPFNEYYEEIATLWEKNPQKLAQYREVIGIHLAMQKNVRQLMKQESGADYRENIPFKCSQRVYKINATGDKRLECMPVSISSTKNTYTQMGAVRYYKIATNSSWMYGVSKNLWIANMSKTNKNSFNPYNEKPSDASVCVTKKFLAYRGVVPSLPFTETGNNILFDTNLLPNGGFLTNWTTDYKAINLQNDDAFWDFATKKKAIDDIGLYEDVENDWHYSGSHWVQVLSSRGDLFFLGNHKLLPLITTPHKDDVTLGYYCRRALFTTNNWKQVPETHLMTYNASMSANQSCDNVLKSFSSVLKNHMNSLK